MQLSPDMGPFRIAPKPIANLCFTVRGSRPDIDSTARPKGSARPGKGEPMSLDRTLSRRGFVIGAAGLAAMASCTSTSWLALAEEKPQTQTPYEATEQADLIVVGAGGAGLSAAVSAVDAGATRVIVLEMTGKTGGSLNLTSGSMSCAESVIQKEDGVEDTVDAYVADIVKTGTAYGGKLDEDMVRLYAEQDIPMFQWLWDHGLKDYEFNADAEGKRAVFAPEHELYSIPRTYKIRKTNDPSVYKSAAHEVIDTYVQGCDAIEVVYNAEAVELVPNADGQVCSVVATGKDGAGTLYTGTHGIVMCTGGFGANRKMMAKYNQYGGEYLIGCGAWSTGRGMQMMQKVGATLVNMEFIPSFPMGLEEQDNPGHGQLASTYTWKAGGICVNKDGLRFMNENDPSPSAREELLIQQPDALQYDVYTDKIIADLQAAKGSMFYDMFYGPEDAMGHWLIHSAPSVAELAEDLGIPADAFEKTVADYNAAVDAGGTDDFGRTYDDSTNSYKLCNNKIEGDTIYAIPIKALVVMTLGGVKCDTNMSVLDADGAQIPGLYAAGEVVGGIWGKFVSGGTGVMGCLTFGRISGANATSETPATGYEVKPASEILDDELFVIEKAEGATFDMGQALSDGDYTATVDGQQGPMEVKVTIEGGKLSGFEVVSNNETASIGGAALPELTEQVLAAGGPDIDGVTGATLTTNRVRDAVVQCLEQAAGK